MEDARSCNTKTWAITLSTSAWRTLGIVSFLWFKFRWFGIAYQMLIFW
jgi:hypothetical protein